MKIQRALIIGANADLGVALAHALADKYHCAFDLLSRDSDQLTRLAKDLSTRYQVQTYTHAVDITDTTQLQQFMEGITDWPDLVISTAGYLGTQSVAQESPLELKKIIDVNFTAQAVLLEHFATVFEQRRSGIIIGISSVSGCRGRRTQYIYGASKAAMTHTLSGLRQRLYPAGVHVMTVLPGYIDTKMIAHLQPPRRLTITTSKLAERICTAIDKKENILYSSTHWHLICMLLKYIPEWLFKRVTIKT